MKVSFSLAVVVSEHHWPGCCNFHMISLTKRPKALYDSLIYVCQGPEKIWKGQACRSIYLHGQLITHHSKHVSNSIREAVSELTPFTH